MIWIHKQYFVRFYLFFCSSLSLSHSDSDGKRSVTDICCFFSFIAHCLSPDDFKWFSYFHVIWIKECSMDQMWWKMLRHLTLSHDLLQIEFKWLLEQLTKIDWECQVPNKINSTKNSNAICVKRGANAALALAAEYFFYWIRVELNIFSKTYRHKFRNHTNFACYSITINRICQPIFVVEMIIH